MLSSYKGHSIFALILAVFFFYNPLIIALTVIGANIPDFDHKFKNENVYKLIILGLVVFIILYILKLPFYLGLIIVFLGVIFYFSEHRSFTHSIFGVFVLTACVGLILIWSYQLLNQITLIPQSDEAMIMVILIAILSFLFLNRKLLMIFLPLFFLSIFILGVYPISMVQITIGLFLGLFSHVVLDSFTPSGIKIFAPLSSKKVHRKFGIVSLIILLIIAILFHDYFGGNVIDFLLNGYNFENFLF